MTTAIPNAEAYPKKFALDDATEVVFRPLEERDTEALHSLFMRIPEEDLYYLKDTVTDKEVIHDWTHNMNWARAIPIEAIVGDEIIADATLHQSRVFARRHVAEARVVVDPRYRRKGLGRGLLRELLNIAADLELYKVYMELVPEREEAAIALVKSMGFTEAATLKGWIRDYYGSYKDVVIMEVSLSDRTTWWRD